MASPPNGQFASAVIIMGGFTIARYFAGRLDAERRVTYENTPLLNFYPVAPSFLGLLLIHGFPRLIARQHDVEIAA